MKTGVTCRKLVSLNKNNPVSEKTLWFKKDNVCDVHKILPWDQIVNLIPDEQVFGRRGRYINDPYILKEVAITDTFLHENFPHVRIKQKWNQVYPAH